MAVAYSDKGKAKTLLRDSTDCVVLLLSDAVAVVSALFRLRILLGDLCCD